MNADTELASSSKAQEMAARRSSSKEGSPPQTRVVEDEAGDLEVPRKRTGQKSAGEGPRH